MIIPDVCDECHSFQQFHAYYCTLYYASISSSMIHRPPASTLPGSSLEMQICRSQPRPIIINHLESRGPGG